MNDGTPYGDVFGAFPGPRESPICARKTIQKTPCHLTDMQYISYYRSPLGNILLAADEASLIGAWFEGQKHFASCLQSECEGKETPLLKQAKHWLDVYFSGQEPDFSIPLRAEGTAFQKEVWKILREIPYGSTVTYGEIASELSLRKGKALGSPRAIGAAVGRNPISILIPCHRVVGANGSLTGFAGGIDKKEKLLALENGLIL